MGDDCNLKLSQVFRTPKDFSRVNFDHFEILERNNFDSSTEKSDPTTNSDIYKSSSSMPKSIANAQIMLRFGGDDILGKNYLETTGKVVSKPFCAYSSFPNHICNYPEYKHPQFSQYPPEVMPVPRHVPPVQVPSHLYSPPYPFYYPHPPQPFAFPGCYYQHINNPAFQQSVNQAPDEQRNGKRLACLFESESSLIS